jgi:hypothetical protein
MKKGRPVGGRIDAESVDTLALKMILNAADHDHVS